MKKRMVIHGEAIFLETAMGSEQFNSMEKVKGQYVGNKLIVAESETTGNHHVLDAKDTDIREKLEKLYISNTEDLLISCVLEKRHDTTVLPVPQSGHVWVRTIAKEYDHVTEVKRNVAD